MDKFAESLIAALEQDLENLKLEIKEPLPLAEAAIKLLVPALAQLKAAFHKHKLPIQEEIKFFKETKPRLACHLIYYNEIYTIETNRPFGHRKALRKYYSRELAKLELFYDDNMEFYRYYRKGSRYLDDKYFLRGKQDFTLTMESFQYQADPKFSTSHDYKAARILANSLLKVYLEAEIVKCQKSSVLQLPAPATPSLKWTGSKVGLVELIYALHTEGAFNNGNSKLSEIALFFESAFHVELGHFIRVFLEIRARKSERTKFLNALRDKLVLRMEEAEGL